MLVRESISFERTGNVKSSLGIGREAIIKKFFNDLNISDYDYEIKPNGEIILEKTLWPSGTKITELPNNLTVIGNAYLSYCKITKLPNNLTVKGLLSLASTNITELPNNLVVNDDLDLRHSKITELPYDIIVGRKIHVHKSQIELIKSIDNTKFKKKLIIAL